MPVWRYVYEEKTLDLIIALISASALLSLVYIAPPQEMGMRFFPKQKLVIKPNL